MTIERINLKKPSDSILTAIHLGGNRISKSGIKIPLVLVLCKCGNEKIIDAYDISLGKTKSCGCTRPTNCGAKPKYSIVIGRLHNIWTQMKLRCHDENNKSYKYYGGKGIYVCDEWRNNYQLFLDWSLQNGYEENLTIDRCDNNKGYEPSNCRWVTLKVNCNNRSTCVFITHGGKTQTVQEWSELLNINRDVLKDKIFNKGLTIGDLSV